jgi:peroxiredoxin Q/BCP
MNLPALGKAAPAFSLPDHNGNHHALKDCKGEIVLVYFYPKALTPGCTVQACGLRDSNKQLKKLGVKVFGISTDPQKLLLKFVEKEKLDFPLLSDEDHVVAEKYGVWGPKKFMGRDYIGLHRMSFIIDRAGKLQHIIDKVNTKTHHADVLAWISANLE